MVRPCIVNCTRTVKSMEKKEFSYNGYANYETWLLSVYDFIPLLAEVLYEQNQDPDRLDYREVQEIFEEYIEQDIPRQAGIVQDMVNASIAEIDFREITEHVSERLQEMINDNY